MLRFSNLADQVAETTELQRALSVDLYRIPETVVSLLFSCTFWRGRQGRFADRPAWPTRASSAAPMSRTFSRTLLLGKSRPGLVPTDAVCRFFSREIHIPVGQ